MRHEYFMSLHQAVPRSQGLIQGCDGHRGGSRSCSLRASGCGSAPCASLVPRHARFIVTEKNKRLSQTAVTFQILF